MLALIESYYELIHFTRYASSAIVKIYLLVTILLCPLSGYISPEYAFDGVCSVKSDIFSFGVLVLEIISGKRTTSFYPHDGKLYNLISYVSISEISRWFC